MILVALVETAPQAFAQDGGQDGPALGNTKQSNTKLGGPSLGVMVRDIPFEGLDALALGHGVEVAGVIDDSPASKAEIAPGDVLVSMGGLPLYSAERLKWLVSKQEVGKTVTLSIHRDGAPPGEMSDVTVTLAPATTRREAIGANEAGTTPWLAPPQPEWRSKLELVLSVISKPSACNPVIPPCPRAWSTLAATALTRRPDRPIR